MENRPEVDWSAIKMVVFDVDGTLYDQPALRKRMLRILLTHYGLRPWKARELQVLNAFRHNREMHAGEYVKDLDQVQFSWCAEKTGVPAEHIRTLVTRWMELRPLPLLSQVRFPGVVEFFEALKEQDIHRAIYSDYPFEAKLQAMGISYDSGISSTDPKISCLKPHPAGLQYLAELNAIPLQQILFVGDRMERDGQCAENAGVKYLIINQRDPEFYVHLTNQLRGRQD